MRFTPFIIILLTFIFLLPISFFSCQQNGYISDEISKTTSIASQNQLTEVIADGVRFATTFEEDIQNCSGIVVAEMIGKSVDPDTTICCQFKISDILLGQFENDSINVHAIPSGDITYLPGIKYVLILYQVDLVFYSTPRYYSVADYDIQVNENDEFVSFIKNGQLVDEYYQLGSFQNFKKSITEIKSTQSTTRKTLDLQGDYSRASDLNTVLNQSDFVAKVIPKTEIISGVYSVMYECEVIEVYKGELPDMVRIHFSPDVISNQEYLVMLVATTPEESQTTFTVSSVTSQFQKDTDQFRLFQGTSFASAD